MTSALSLLKGRLNGRGIAPFEIELPDQSVHRVGEAGAGCRFRLRVRTDQGLRALASLDEAAIGEAYINGHIDLTGDFLAALDLRTHFRDSHLLHKAWRFLRPLLLGRNRTDKTLTPRHYDHGNDFYFAFLDRTHRLYSQALFTAEAECLERAAENKLEYIHGICRLKAGARVLDVGAGWGSFARYAAARGVDVTMLTVSSEQCAYLRNWCGKHDLPVRLEVVMESIYAYTTAEPFDAVVILGVMEHLPDYRGLFARLDRLLQPQGRVYLDFSAARTKFASSTFTHRFVFQGNHSPVLMPELLAAAGASPFEVVAIHNDRHSYFLTLRAWARNLEAAHDDIAARFGEATYRMFLAYLWGGAHNMRTGGLESYRVVFQKSRRRPSFEVGV